MKNLFLPIAFILVLSACKSPQIATSDGGSTTEEMVAATEPDTSSSSGIDSILSPSFPEESVLTAPEPAPVPEDRPLYQESYHRDNDLLHTRLELAFNWEEEEVLGKAKLKLKPLYHPVNSLTLDAKGFEFHSIKLPEGTELDYTYNGLRVTIQLDKTYTRDETYELMIDYSAFPSEDGGSAAITSDKGLFFINPTGETPNKPRQIWTQGETENNSKWFPTIDKPNERCTQEVYVTVPDEMVSLSNGVLTSSVDNEDGTRTDYWVMEQPHAPYLFMLAIGKFAVVKEEWNGIPIEYYVEPEYEEDAKKIFDHTPEMLSFFSEKVGITYPWPKYAQVVVRDYVSGAMENTTAVVFGDFVQQHTGDLIDEGNDNIVAHEMFHHWFGDYVTCESWANLTMNEGFANYSEYLWLEHKYGREIADLHALSERSGYFYSTSNGEVHPLIHFGYDDKEEMFDAHSYNKGGAVLHMLRHYVGDDAFFAALNTYLADNAYTAVEAHNLRLAFEKVTGEDLNWFFNQWFFQQGHPKLDVSHIYDPETSTVTLSVAQTHTPEFGDILYRIPSEVDIHFGNGMKIRHEITIDQQQQEFAFAVDAAPKAVIFDPEHVLLAEISTEQNLEEEIFIFQNSPNILDRLPALQFVARSEYEGTDRLVTEALEDPVWEMRNSAAAYFEGTEDAQIQQKLMEMAKNDPHASVRATALRSLTTAEAEGMAELTSYILEADSAYSVIGSALSALNSTDSVQALQLAEKLEEKESYSLLAGVAQVYSQSGDSTHLDFFMENVSRFDGWAGVGFLSEYATLLGRCSPRIMEKGAEDLYAHAIDSESDLFQRYGSAMALFQLKEEVSAQVVETGTEKYQLTIDKLEEFLLQIKEQETDEQLKQLYQQF